MMRSKEEFIAYYKKTGSLLNEVSKRKNKLNEVQLESKYQKYIQKVEKDNQKNEEKRYTIDEDWESLKLQLDMENCQLIKRLKEEKMDKALKELKFNASWLINTIDPAHIFPRSGYPYLKYEVINVVPLNRFSHSCIDTMRDPINGKHINKEEQQLFWLFIAGKTCYNELEKRIKDHECIR